MTCPAALVAPPDGQRFWRDHLSAQVRRQGARQEGEGCGDPREEDGAAAGAIGSGRRWNPSTPVRSGCAPEEKGGGPEGGGAAAGTTGSGRRWNRSIPRWGLGPGSQCGDPGEEVGAAAFSRFREEVEPADTDPERLLR
jgi:hypothetical protein